MPKPSDRRTRQLVYSTELGRVCPECRQAVDRCRCRHSTAPVGDGKVRVRRESRRGGKGVTLVTGLPLDADAVRQLAAELRKRCGSGGTVKDGVIEIQGDHRDVVLDVLNRAGFNAKLAGG